MLERTEPRFPEIGWVYQNVLFEPFTRKTYLPPQTPFSKILEREQSEDAQT